MSIPKRVGDSRLGAALFKTPPIPPSMLPPKPKPQTKVPATTLASPTLSMESSHVSLPSPRATFISVTQRRPCSTTTLPTKNTMAK